MQALKELNIKHLVFIDIETVRNSKELVIDSPEFDAWAYLKRRGNVEVTDVDLQKSYVKESKNSIC